MNPVDILVVGAGPTGLTLALQAHAHGANVRIIDRRAEPFRPSRALILHPRTLEVLPLGVTGELLARANTTPRGQLHAGSRSIDVTLADFALADTPYPHLSFIRQSDVEAVLSKALSDRGVAVDWGTECISATDGRERASAVMCAGGGTKESDWDFIVGCDGPESAVRRSARIEFRGKPYREEVVLADVELETPLTMGIAHVAAGRRGLLFLFTLGEQATWRLLATQPRGPNQAPFGQTGPPVSHTELQSLIDHADMDARVTALAWSARYGLQRRLATQFRRGRLFIAGDAAHAHSPAGGLGMNTGIQDAANLGWKLAFSGGARGREALLDSYEIERRMAAKRVLLMTHVAFWAEASTAPLPSLLRGTLVPLGVPAIPFIMARRRLVAGVIRVISQLGLFYANSPISREGEPGLRCGPAPGKRLPDASVVVDGQEARLHSLLARPGVHVLLHREAPDVEQLAGRHVAMHRLNSAPGTGLVAVRPDGYVGLRCGTADINQLRSWLESVGARSQQ